VVFCLFKSEVPLLLLKDKDYFSLLLDSSSMRSSVSAISYFDEPREYFQSCLSDAYELAADSAR